ncbi:MAG: phage holin family protein [Bacteroidota bacterium]|nr:phage holin family protein [Bacteroidota bacterium]
MENRSNSIEELFYKLKEYIDLRIDLFKLKSINKISGFLSTLIVVSILAVLAFLVLICITIGVALLLGEILGKTYYGFLVMALLYIIIGLVLYYGRNKFLKKPISNNLIKELLD